MANLPPTRFEVPAFSAAQAAVRKRLNISLVPLLSGRYTTWIGPLRLASMVDQSLIAPENTPQICATLRSTAEPALLNGMVTDVATDGTWISAP